MKVKWLALAGNQTWTTRSGVQRTNHKTTAPPKRLAFICYPVFCLNRDNAKRLVYENDMLQMQMSSTERDTLDVISYLKQEDAKKDDQV